MKLLIRKNRLHHCQSLFYIIGKSFFVFINKKCRNRKLIKFYKLHYKRFYLEAYVKVQNVILLLIYYFILNNN